MQIIDPAKEVQILTQNFLDSGSTIVSSHGGTTGYLWDRDSTSAWKSTNGGRDLTAVTLTFTFNVGGVETQFTLNQLLILRTNIKDFKLEWFKSSDSTWHSVVEAGIQGSYGCYRFGAVLTSRIRLTMQNTQSPNHEKEIGDLILARVRHVMTRGFTQYTVGYRQKASAIDLGDGGLAMAYSRPLGGRLGRYGATCVFSFLPRADYDFLYCLKNEGDPFLFYPEAVTRPDEVWLVQWTNPFTASYMTTVAGNGYTLQMELMEL